MSNECYDDLLNNYLEAKIQGELEIFFNNNYNFVMFK